MSRIIKINLLVIFYIFSNLYSQETKIEVKYYQAIINKEITKSDKPKILKDLDYVLQFTKNESVFYNIPRMESDGFRSNNRYVRKSGASGIYYKNVKTKEKFKSVNLLGKAFLIKSSLKQNNWVLTKMTKKIGKYKCYKAYYKLTNPKFPNTSITITAWYTIELPFPFGPVGFDGLPGLVLEVDYLDYAFVANKISFNKDFTIIKPKGDMVSNEEFMTYFKNQTGIDIGKKYKERAKKEKRNHY